MPTPTALRVGRRSRHGHRAPRSRGGRLGLGNVSVFGRVGLFARTGLGLPAQFGRACSCGLGALLGTNELFFCCRERIWSFGGRWVGVGVRHWSWAIAGASTSRLTARSGLHTENHVITLKSLAGRAVRTGNIRRASSVCDLLRRREFSYRPCKNISVRFIVVMVAALIGVGALMPPTAAAGPTVCDYPACTLASLRTWFWARRAITPPTTRSGYPAVMCRPPNPDG